MGSENKRQLWRYVSIFEMLAGIVLLALSYQMGKAHFALIQHGMRAPGKIIGYQKPQPSKQAGTSATPGGANAASDSSNPTPASAMKPFVEYKTNDHVIHFTDWKETTSSSGLNQSVTVLYDPVHPGMRCERPELN